MAIFGIFGLSLPIILLGILIAVFGSIVALLLNVHEQNEELEKKLDFMIEKSGWKKDWEEKNDDLTPEQLGKLLDAEERVREKEE